MKRVMCILIPILGACGGDPVRDHAVDVLGAEPAGESPGPRHRAGQPCTTCHREDGVARGFAVGGTIFTTPGGREGAEGLVIELADRNGSKRQVMTNGAGNFYVASEDWKPAFPIGVRVMAGDQVIAMKTGIMREGSCAKCHVDPAGPTSAGALYASELRERAPR